MGILYQQEASYFEGGIVNVYKVLPKYSIANFYNHTCSHVSLILITYTFHVEYAWVTSYEFGILDFHEMRKLTSPGNPGVSNKEVRVWLARRPFFFCWQTNIIGLTWQQMYLVKKPKLRL